MRKDIWSELTPAALWKPYRFLGARKGDQDSFGEALEYSDDFQPEAVQLSKC